MNDTQFTGSRFVGGDWENGFGVHFSHSQDNVQALFTPQERHEGPPDICHGGVTSTLLDEAMTAAAAVEVGLPIFTVTMNISFLAPIFIGTQVTITAKVISIEGRKVQLEAQITLPDDTVAATAKALFIRPKEIA